MRDLVSEAKQKYEKIKRLRKSPRFQKVIGKLIAMKLLHEKDDVEPFTGKVKLADFLWAGEIEPRVWELLPALVLKKPAAIEGLASMPDDLAAVVKALQSGEPKEPFRGIAPQAYSQWVTFLSSKSKEDSVLKSFRFKPQELQHLAAIKSFGYTETDAIREGLKLLYNMLKATSTG